MLTVLPRWVLWPHALVSGVGLGVFWSTTLSNCRSTDNRRNQDTKIVVNVELQTRV